MPCTTKVFLMTESFKSFIMDDKLCNTSTIWSDPNSHNLADFLLDALLNGNFNQIPTPLQECSLALQLTNLLDSSLVTATISAPYCGPYLIDMFQGTKGQCSGGMGRSIRDFKTTIMDPRALPDGSSREDNIYLQVGFDLMKTWRCQVT